MKVVSLMSPTPVYSAYAYLLLGEWNRLEDVNTLIDAGTDGSIVDLLPGIHTGVGKRPVEQTILTHSHFDHAGGVARVVRASPCPVLAAAPTEGVTRVVRDGEIIRVADRDAEILLCAEHSMDSLCVYVHDEGILFSGDTPLGIRSPGGSYGEDFLVFLQRLSRLPIRAIYAGHDHPVLQDATGQIERTLAAVERSTILS